MGDGAAPSSWCKAGATTAAQMQAELCLDLKSRSDSCHHVGDVTKVTSLRTDTTLDLSQKAEKVYRYTQFYMDGSGKRLNGWF